MKKVIFYLFTGCLALILWQPALSQKISKAEKKALLNEIKAYQKNPLRYKQFKQGIQEKKEMLQSLNKEAEDLNEAIDSKQKVLNEKELKIKELGDEIARLKTASEETDKAIRNQTNIEGLVYKVQVEIDDAQLYQEVSEIDGKKRPVFTGDEDEDGKKKYTLGYFKSKNEAETFKKYLNMLRIRDAIIVAYKDGKRIEQ